MKDFALNKSIFRKVENTEHPGAPLKLHDYLYPTLIQYYKDDGQIASARPMIYEYYSSPKQNHIGGYCICFDLAITLGSFRTFDDAVEALNDYINTMRKEGHPAAKWTYDKAKGEYQMNYTF